MSIMSIITAGTLVAEVTVVIASKQAAECKVPVIPLIAVGMVVADNVGFSVNGHTDLTTSLFCQ